MKLETAKDTIQSCNVNCLVGSGLSRPYLITLGKIEILLDALDKETGISEEIRTIVKSSLYKTYFEGVMVKNLDSYKMTGDEAKNYSYVLNNYKEFLQHLNEIILFRYNTLLNKQINIFTTNVDLFFEKALEETMIEFNDGFKGRLNPIFNLSNFQKSYKKTSLHYKNTSEIPVINLLKLHGSINWKKDGDRIVLSNLSYVLDVDKALNELTEDSLVTVSDESKIEDLIAAAKKKSSSMSKEKLSAFMDCYQRLQVVNPTKEKFRSTLLNTNYYEMLRMYANELEKENTLLFVLGFSFADEHIREITIRAANSNPTLQLYIIAFDSKAKTDIIKILKIEENSIANNNVHVVDPEQFLSINSNEESKTPFDSFSFENINKMLFEPICERVNQKIVRRAK